MTTPLESLKALISDRAGGDIVKGEVWLGSDLFGGPPHDTVDSHLRLADQLNHTLACLPVQTAGTVKPDLGYAYFSLSALEQAAALWDGPVLGVIDGPFQEMVNALGLLEVLTLWMQDWPAIESSYHDFAQGVGDLADRIADLPVAGLIFTDDLAADSGPMVSPDYIDTLCTPFYSKVAAKLRAKGKAVFFHSCGNLASLVPLIRSWQVDGLAAIQSRVNAFDTLFTQFNDGTLILGGIEADLLQSRDLDADAIRRIKELVRGDNAANLILGSSCGLFQADFLDKVKEIYRAAAE